MRVSPSDAPRQSPVEPEGGWDGFTALALPLFVLSLAAGEQDFIVKVYAAVVTSDTSVDRTPACAVITPEQIPAWLASLPPQRSLSSIRRAELLDQIRSIA